jgi:Cu/Ag efflux protein CusF
MALPIGVQAQAAADMPAAAVATSIQGVSTIEKIDAKTREVTLKREDGSLVTIVAGEEVRNFAQMKVGDIVEVEIIDALALALEPAHTQVRERVDSYGEQRAKPGEKPGMKTTHTVEAIGTVQEIDTKTRQVTVKGAVQTVVLQAGENVDLSKIKKGDNVRAVYIESISIPVKAPGK